MATTWPTGNDGQSDHRAGTVHAAATLRVGYLYLVIRDHACGHRDVYGGLKISQMNHHG